MQNPFLPLISFFVAALLCLGILSGIEAFREKVAPKQSTPTMVSVYTNDCQPPSQTTHKTILVYTNDCPICTPDGDKCRFNCPFCKEGDHSFNRHIDRTKEFLCPVCCCYHKASKELMRSFKVLLKTREQQAALFPSIPPENNP